MYEQTRYVQQILSNLVLKLGCIFLGHPVEGYTFSVNERLKSKQSGLHSVLEVSVNTL